jgi:cell cycle checkpoint control protein RAD9A
MQATIDSFALKRKKDTVSTSSSNLPTTAFVRALTCLSRYGDELLIHATTQTLSFSVTSSSMSAYSRFMWDRQFFVRYQIGSSNKGKEKEAKTEEDGSVVLETVKGQLMVKVNANVIARP